ncbi:MAG TPA: serine protease [Burkholderiales bacterium]|nr:serine protease [Burkholderiales bacterium]
MNIKRTLLATLVCAASGLIPAAAVLAQDPEGSSEEAADEAERDLGPHKGNWAVEYVELRKYAMVVRATGMAGAPPLRRNGRIVGGQPAEDKDNPFQVGLLLKSIADNYAAQFCGGTLIGPDVVVTAAHCSDFVQAGSVQVLTGARKLDGTGVRRDVAKITVHPQWNPQTFDYDVAVWKLSTSADGSPLATLARRDGTVGTNLLATGWGTLTQGGTRPTDLYKVLVPVASRVNCNDTNSYNGKITKRMLCAGRDSGGIDTCQGDSGGPLTGGNTSSVLTGIVSWGEGCARPNLFGVYTRVSNKEIRQFIESNQ